jgi:hypothetical protein
MRPRTVGHHDRLDTFRSLNASRRADATTDNQRTQLRKLQMTGAIHEQLLPRPENPWVSGHRSLGRTSSTLRRRCQWRLTASHAMAQAPPVTPAIATSKAARTRGTGKDQGHARNLDPDFTRRDRAQAPDRESDVWRPGRLPVGARDRRGSLSASVSTSTATDDDGHPRT